MNRMQDKPTYTMPMDVFGRQRHDPETVITIIDFPTSQPKGDPMRYDTVLRLKDDSGTDQSATSTSTTFQTLLRTRPNDVAAASQRLGPTATIQEIVQLIEQLDADGPMMDQANMAAQRHYIDASKALNDRVARGQAEDRWRKLVQDAQANAAVPMSKRFIPTRIY